MASAVGEHLDEYSDDAPLVDVEGFIGVTPTGWRDGFSHELVASPSAQLLQVGRRGVRQALSEETFCFSHNRVRDPSRSLALARHRLSVRRTPIAGGGDRATPPSATALDEYEQRPARDAGRDARCSFEEGRLNGPAAHACPGRRPSVSLASPLW